jgi:hypothetical protein
MAQIVQSAPPGFGDAGPLPVRVRTKSGEIVGSGVTGAPIDVPAGSYFVTVMLPDGRETGLDRRVRAGQDAPMMAGDAPPAEAPPAATVEAPPPAAPEVEERTLHAGLWHGDWMGAWAKGPPNLSALATEEIALVSSSLSVISQHETGDRVLVLPLEDRYRCSILPYDMCRVCIDPSAQAPAIAIRAVESPEGPVFEFRSLVSQEANALLGFVEGGVLTNMVAVTEDEVRRGEQALSQSGASVLRAITGAYVLLRANMLDGLDRWLAQLDPMGGDLPDLLPLQAELAARSGDHGGAVTKIREWLDESRCPWFRAGFSYMLDRLRLYLDVSDNQRASFNLDAATYRRFEDARDRLDPMLTSMLTSRYIATFDILRESK